MLLVGTGAMRRERRCLALFLFFSIASIADLVSSFLLPSSDSERIKSTCTHSYPQPSNILLYSSFTDGNSDPSFPDNNNEGGQATSTKRRQKKSRLPQKNLYDVLGANQSMSRQDIKRLYITLAKEYHPDSAGPEYVDRFDEIARAWDVLSDKKAKLAYDRELAAAAFKEDIMKRAGAVANEYGPTARAFYEDIALPFLRRTATTTIAGWSAIADTDSERDGADVNNYDTSSPPPPPPQVAADFGQKFQRVIEAGRNATRQIDGLELQEKSDQLRLRADETRAESFEILDRLSQIKAERLHLTFHTSSAEFSSSEALEFLDGFNTVDEQTLLDRVTFRHPIANDIEAFQASEEDLEYRQNEKLEVDREFQARKDALEEAEQQAQFALMEEERIIQMLENARQNVADTQQMVADAQVSLNSLNPSVRTADQNLSKSQNHLKRRRDVVRKALIRKEEKNGGVESKKVPSFMAPDENNRNRERPFSAFRRSSMSDIGFDQQNLEKIEALKAEEALVEREFLGLVELTSKLVSRSEKLRIQSEELIGRNMPDREMLEEDMFYEADTDGQEMMKP